MNLKNLDDFMKKFWDWTFLNKCFWPTTIRVTDIDGFVERNDKFLFIETKDPGVDIPIGQQKLFDSIIRRGDSYLVIWGKQGHPPYRVFFKSPTMVSNERDATEATIQRITESWFKSANESVEARAGKFSE